MSEGTAQPERVRLELGAMERRVLGVLIEKGLTTPEYYPMTLNAIVTGCNQKNNRDPLTTYDESQVEETLQTLQGKGLVASIWPASGRAVRWREELTKKHGLSGVELGVVGELLLRGAQTEGELRGRASRMRPIPDLEQLHTILEKLRQMDPPFVIRLSPEGAARGVRVTHALYLAVELERVLADESAGGGGEPATATGGAAPAPPRERGEDLRSRLAALEERVARLERQLGGG
jgi:uncharacterized protein YceH (UPF0502 family)